MSINSNLKKIYIESNLPKELLPLQDIAQNLWWTWNEEAIKLFQDIHPKGWIKANYNPLVVLDQISSDRANELAQDQEFLKRLNSVNGSFQTYMNKPKDPKQPKIAYFCMEYGLHISLRLYSGGLGILAGDYLKEASDLNVDLFAVGLLYRYGYFQQSISLHGDQINNYPSQQFTRLPVKPVRRPEGDWLKITIDLKGRIIYAKVWSLQVGRITLYLLDTDIDDNSTADRSLTHHLYGGDNEHRLKQEILLGIGGIRAVKAMNIHPDVYHCNEGHAAFLGLERLKNLVKEEGLTYNEAIEVVRSTSLFTTHTPVPAGHDHFSEGLMSAYLYHFSYDLGVSWDKILALGRYNPNDPGEDFSMSHLAIRLSQEVNGVSKLHGHVSQEMFSKLYPGYIAEELFIDYVTNGVHYPTWIANELHNLYTDTFGNSLISDQSNQALWEKIHTVPDEKLFEIRQLLKKRLLDSIRKSLKKDLTFRGENPRTTYEILDNIQDNALVVGFARRFATYKRAHLLFSNLERLSELVNNPDHPMMFIFAGKAHPADGGGQGLIRRIVQISKQEEFRGKIIFLENYNMETGKLLTQGVDIWLNTPTRPKEASGTSGMKAAINGIVNLSVLDGWWAEGYRSNAGWSLPMEKTYQDQSLQDALDAEMLYSIFEREIIPIYFEQNEMGFSPKWIAYTKNMIAEVAPHFTMKRMMDDYYRKFYNKLFEKGNILVSDHYEQAKDFAAWKKTMMKDWDTIELLESDQFDTENHPLPAGKPFEAKVKIYINGLPYENIGVEVVFFRRTQEERLSLELVHELQMSEVEGNVVSFGCNIQPPISGVYEYGFRVFPKHPLMSNRQDLPIAKWL